MNVDSARIDSSLRSHLRDQPGLNILITKIGICSCIPKPLFDTPSLYHFQPAPQKFLAAQAALNLAAGSSRDTARYDQDNLMDLNFVLFGNRFANAAENLIGIKFLPPRDLLNQHHALAGSG